jgi:hypothetical protein
LLVALVLVREAARWDHLRRERRRHAVRYYWEREETFGTFVDTGGMRRVGCAKIILFASSLAHRIWR